MFFKFILQSSIQKTFDDKTKSVEFLKTDEMKKEIKTHNEAWWFKIFVINVGLILLSMVSTGVLVSQNHGAEALTTFFSNIVNTFAVLLIQLYMFNRLNNYNSLSPIGFELSILSSLEGSDTNRTNPQFQNFIY
jgi:hypothetical protein